tara:strand:+ start:282 stop:596 length:315 start_codon:yes stop_codon:yes gene_type:complete
MSYSDYLTNRPFLSMGGPQGLGSSQTPYGDSLLGMFSSIDRFMEQHGGGEGTSELPVVSMHESSPYAQALESLFGSGLGDMPVGDVMAPDAMGPDYVQSRAAYI